MQKQWCKQLIRSLVLMLISGVPALLMAQDNDLRAKDWRFRTGPTLAYEFTEDWSVDINWESRFNRNISKYRESLLEAIAAYRTPWSITVQAIYRHYFVPAALNEYRYTFGAEYDRLIGNSDLEWSVRARWQRENAYALEADEQATHWRVKFSLDYELTPRFGLVLEDELFYEVGGVDRWDKNRITSGVEIGLTPALELMAFYRYEWEWNQQIPAIDHTLGLFLEYKIKRYEEDPEKPRRFGHPFPW